MSAIIFDGKAAAASRKLTFKKTVATMQKMTIYSLVFQEDTASVMYASLKKKDAEEVGIAYEIESLPIATPVKEVLVKLKKAAERNDVTGIIVQKPMKSLEPTEEWWGQIVRAIPKRKDVDGLKSDEFVLPATARAILTILDDACVQLKDTLEKKSALVLGRSAIVGTPVAQELQRKNMHVLLFGRQELAKHPEVIAQADVVVCATGQQDLLQATQLKPGVIVIDAGSPKPEVNLDGLDDVARFRTPVPGGVGPMTRISLLENQVDLVSFNEL